MNSLSHIEAFITLWDKNSFSKQPQAFKKSPLNNINQNGDCDSDASVIFTKNDSLFYDAIEEGIKPLVFLLVEKFGWITFSSCAGHLSYNGQPYKKRMVQLLPRTEIEATQIMSQLRQTIEAAHIHLAGEKNPIDIKILEENLIGDQKHYHSIKLVFSGNDLPEKIYFTYLDAATHSLCKQLDEYIRE